MADTYANMLLTELIRRAREGYRGFKENIKDSFAGQQPADVASEIPVMTTPRSAKSSSRSPRIPKQLSIGAPRRGLAGAYNALDAQKPLLGGKDAKIGPKPSRSAPPPPSRPSNSTGSSQVGLLPKAATAGMMAPSMIDNSYVPPSATAGMIPNSTMGPEALPTTDLVETVTPETDMAVVVRPDTQIPGAELPYQTYERLTGQKWTGGRSQNIQDMLRILGISGDPGSARTNLDLQRALLQNALNIR